MWRVSTAAAAASDTIRPNTTVIYSNMLGRYYDQEALVQKYVLHDVPCRLLVYLIQTVIRPVKWICHGSPCKSGPLAEKFMY